MAMCRFLPVALIVGLLANDIPAQNPPDNDPPAGSYFLPPRAIKRLGTTRLRHGSRILCLAFPPPGEILAAGGGHDPIRLWDTQTGREIKHLAEPWAQALVFHPRGRTLFSAGAFKSIR